MCVAKTKVLISFVVTAKLICVFVFAYAKNRFSHDAMSRIIRKPAFCICQKKAQISCAVTAQLNTTQLISAFVFATYTVQSLFFLNPNFLASNHLLWLNSPDLVGNPESRFSNDVAHISFRERRDWL